MIAKTAYGAPEIEEVSATRRNFVAGSLAVGSAGLFAQSASAATSVSQSRFEDVVVAAGDCLVKGELCLSHCIRITQAGDASLGNCMQTVSTMLTICQSVMRLAAIESPALKEMVKVAKETCEACRVECEKHAMHHTECEACMEACAKNLDVMSKSALL